MRTALPAPVAPASASLPRTRPRTTMMSMIVLRIRRLEWILILVTLALVVQVVWVTLHLHDRMPPSLSIKSLFPDTESALALAVYSFAQPVTEAATKAIATADSAANLTEEEIRRRRQEWRKHHWDPARGLSKRPARLKVGLPIFVPSLPKSGTTSIWQYFNCGGHKGSHQWVKRNESYTEQSARCIRRNVEVDLPPFQDCGDYEVYSDTGFALYLAGGILPNVPVDCYYPSVQALEAIYRHYPTCTIVHVIRNVTSWYNSMVNWGEGSLLTRWKICNITGFPSWTSGPAEMMKFYQWHTNNIRQFAAAHPSIKYVEVRLESKTTGKKLQREIGITSKCWGKCTPESKFCKRTGSK